ncbi:FliJ family protein [Pelagibius litoralis]|uniref:Flagellar FliJ protein n=1 Tax=Pelagibius litoralis TaxID=374515 RepID=A0A967K8V8_9PROT|nr:flagellar export protein FliJ [Pelagibius litoralis]NIA69492.1 FliJ family protein [Pelagibius litoralis]
MTALDQLVRVHRWNLDEKRQKLAELERLRERLVGNISVLDAELQREKEVAAVSDVTSIALPAFIRATLERRKKIEESVAEVDRSIAAARDEITDAFQEFKKYETAHGNHQRREAQKHSKREQAVADEIGLELHRRQVASGS